tara:strand:- start:1396 stop:3837 length:2442 start_codon:yes stop_codon:yes gene_type:complete
LYEIEVFQKEYLDDYSVLFRYILQPVSLEMGNEYKAHLDLDLSVEGLTKIREHGALLKDLNFDLATELKLPGKDILAIKFFSSSVNDKNRIKIKKLCDWWTSIFSPLSDKNILFSKCTSSRNQIKDYKSDFLKTTNLDMDFIHGLICVHTQLENSKQRSREQKQTLDFKIRDLNSEIDILEEKQSEMETRSAEELELLSKEISNSTLGLDVKAKLLPGLDLVEYWDDPRTILHFSIRSNIGQNIHGTYSNNVKKIKFGIESLTLPFGDALITWDDKDQTADSCRIHFSRHHVSIAISDGATQGGFNSGLFSNVLTHFVSSYMPVSTNGMYYFNRKPMRELYNKILHDSDSLNGGIHSKIRALGSERAEQFSSSIYKRGALANIAHVIIQRSGAFQASRFGDCCIFKLTNKDTISHINVDPNLKENATNLIGPSTSWVRDVRGNIAITEGLLEDEEILFGCTDKVAEYIVGFPEEAAVLVRKLSEKSRQSISSSELFHQVATTIQGEDDLCLFTYRHLGQNMVENEVICTENGAERLVIDGVEYEVIEADRYFANIELGKGVKRIEKTVYNNLRHFHDSFNNRLDFFVDIELGVSYDGKETIYFAFMPHLGQNGYTNLGFEMQRLANNYGTDQTGGIDLLRSKLEKLSEQFEQSRVTHLDIGPSNIFIDESTGGLVCIDPNAFYNEGTFVRTEIGHPGMYGTDSIPTHVTCLLNHRFGIKVMIFSLELLKSGIRFSENDDIVQEIWANFGNQEDTLFLTPEELDMITLPNLKTNADRIIALINRLSERFNLPRDEIESWIYQFDCEELYSFELS